MSKASRIKIEQWADGLTKEQLVAVAVELVDFAIDAEMVAFWEAPEYVAPYWDNTGEPLVAGQQTCTET